jgi:site-specific recombinase XerC
MLSAASTATTSPQVQPPQAPPASVRVAIVRYLAHVREENRADSTQTSYLYQLSTVFHPVLSEPPAALTRDCLARLRHRIQTTVNTRTGAPYSEATVLLYWSVSRKFCRWCFLQGWIGSDPTKAGAL